MARETVKEKSPPRGIELQAVVRRADGTLKEVRTHKLRPVFQPLRRLLGKPQLFAGREDTTLYDEKGATIYQHTHDVKASAFSLFLPIVPLLTPELITNAGLARAAGQLVADVGGAGFDYVAVGTDDGTLSALAAANTALGAEILTGGAERRGAANVTGTLVQTNVADDTSQWVTTFTFTASHGINEVGVFDANVSGTMLLRQIFANTLNVSNGDSLTLTIKVVNT